MPHRPQRTTELLAPAGDWESLRAAVANGADAVYFGLDQFNARYRAENFTLEELPQVMQFLHDRNVRGYVAFNTLVFSDELTRAMEYLAAINDAGVDAVIMQDLGLAELAAKAAPGLALHGSTQMTLTEPLGVEFVKRLGISRVILARELSVTDVGAIGQAADMSLEVFVHGALCVSYSGQCLTSEALGGRSANRGQCAQACRLPYDLLVDGVPRDLGDRAYLLSPQDLAAYELVEPLVAAGVECLKIEGRLKSAAYVAATTAAYRRALDAALQQSPYQITQQERLDLEQSFSRGFSPGFLAGVDHQRLVHARFPKSRGVQAGTVIETSDHQVIVALAAGLPADILKPGDGVVFDQGRPQQDEQGGRLFGVRPRRMAGHGSPAGRAACVALQFGHGAVNTAAIEPGSLVWKTDDPELRRRMARSFAQDRPARRQLVEMRLRGRVGGPLTLTARLDDNEIVQATATWPGPLSLARKHPMDEMTARDQLGRLGETPFELGAVTLDFDASLMVPKSVLNDLRRQAIEQLTADRDAALRQRQFRRTLLPERRQEIARQASQQATNKAPADLARMYVLVRTQEQLAAALDWRPAQGLPRPALVYCDFEEVRRHREAVLAARSAAMPIGLATLRVLKPNDAGLVRQIAHLEPDAALVRNLGSLEVLRAEAPHVPRIGDYSLNVANELTADLFFRHGLQRLVPSYDLDWPQLAALLKRSSASRFEAVVHQHMPMFHMEHCVFAATLSTGKDYRDCGRPCDRHLVSLRDRTGAELPLAADTGCRNTVFNAVPQSAAEYIPRLLGLGVRHFRIELLRETAAETRAVLDQYSRVLAGIEDGRAAWRRLNALDQLGVTRGTLQVLQPPAAR